MEGHIGVLLGSCAGDDAPPDHRNAAGALWNFPMLVSMLRQVGFAQKCDVQIPVVGPYVDKIPFLSQFASSVAKQSPKYPNV